MPFPTGYNNVNVNSFSFEQLRTGGHKCKVMDMVVKASSTGNKIIEITFDTTMDDIQPNFYVNSKYPGKYTTVVDERLRDRNGEAYGLTNLKRLVTAFEDSNDGFKVVDDNYGVNDAMFCKQFIGRNIGMVMREEEYVSNRDGSIKSSVKAMRLCNYSKAFEQKVPTAKKVERANQNEFVPVVDSLDDTSLPFN